MNATRTESLWTRRDVLVRVAFGSVAGIALTACGGGGGSSSGDAQALKDAYPKLREGMYVEDVEALVGFPANDLRTSHELEWAVGDVNLYVSFRTPSPGQISTASLRVGSSPSTNREFKEVL